MGFRIGGRLLLTVLCACTTSPRVVGRGGTQTRSGPVVAAQQRVVVLPADVAVERINSGSPPTAGELAAFEQDRRDLPGSFDRVAKDALRAKGLSCVALEELGSGDLADAIRAQLRTWSRRGIDAQTDAALLERLSRESKAAAVVIPSLAVRVGHGFIGAPGFSPSFSGATHTADLRIRVVALPDGRELWSREVFVRQYPTDAVCGESLRLMLEELEVSAENRR